MVIALGRPICPYTDNLHNLKEKKKKSAGENSGTTRWKPTETKKAVLITAAEKVPYRRSTASVLR